MSLCFVYKEQERVSQVSGVNRILMRWRRDFQIIAQAKRIWSIVIGKEALHASLNAMDFGFGETEKQYENDRRTTKEDKGKGAQSRIDDSPEPLTAESGSITTHEKLMKAVSGRKSGRYPLAPHETHTS